MNEKRIAFLGTFFVHLIVVGLLFLIKYGPALQFHRIEVLEFGYADQSNNEQYVSTPSGNQSNLGTKSLGSKTNIIPDKVNLPTTISKGEEVLSHANSKFTAFNQLEMDEKVGVSSAKEETPENIYKGLEEKEADKALVDTDSDYLSSLTSNLEGSADGEGPYLLEGDILTRSILKKVIPQYPEGIQKTSRVKIRFEVDSKGIVNNLLVTQKADPQLEKISIDALKQWKFSPLTKDITQIGFITFIYQLK